MRRSAISILAALLASSSLGASRQAPPATNAPQLTLADAVVMALADNDRLLSAAETVEQAGLSIRAARSAFGPKLTPNALGSFGRSNLSNQSYSLDFNQQFLTGTQVRASIGALSEQNQFGNFFSSDTTVQVSQPLLRGFGRALARSELTEAESRSGDATRQRRLAEQQVAIEVASTYYRIIAQTQMLEVAENALARARGLVDASRARLAVGRVSQLDVFRAEQLAALSELQLVNARAGLDDAKDQLRFLINRNADYAFAVAPDIPVPQQIDPSPADPVTIALSNRLEYRSAQEAVAQAERAAANARDLLRPQFDVSLLLARRQTGDTLRSSFGLDNFQVTTFAALSMPLDGTRETIAQQTASIELQRRRRALESSRRLIEQDVRRAVRQQERMLLELQLADASVDFASQEVEVATLRNERGLANNLDVVNAEGSLLGATAQRIGLLASLAVARLEVRAALGVLDPRADVR